MKNVLGECYGDKTEVSDELVDYILTPGLEVSCARDIENEVSVVAAKCD